MTTSEIDLEAANGREMPEGLNSAQQRLFQTLRYIYFKYKKGWIEQKEGAREKLAALSAYEVDELYIRANADAIEIRTKLAGALNEKSECETCRKIARILDGRNGHEL